MDKELREEREFSENVDRLLAGKEMEAGYDISEELRKAMSFSKKLVELRQTPSPQFKAELKKELLLKFDERQAEHEERARISFWQVFKNFMPRSPVWRGATVTVAIGVLAILAIWATGIFSQSPGTGTVTEGSEMLSVPSAARVQLETLPSDTLVQSVGEAFKVDIIFKNVSADSITVEPYPPRIEIQQADTNDVVRSFAQGTDKREIAPSEGLIYMLVWDQRDDSGQQVGSGRYILVISGVAVLKDAKAEDAFAKSRPLIELVIQ